MELPILLKIHQLILLIILDDPGGRQGRKCDSDQNRVNIMPFIAEVERYFISDRAASALYNAALTSVGVIKAGDTKNIVDKCKIVRGRYLYRASEKGNCTVYTLCTHTSQYRRNFQCRKML